MNVKVNSILKFSILVVIIFSISVSCSQIGKTKVGFLIPASVGYRWPIDQAYVEKAATVKNVEVITRSAENDENLQLKQAKELLEMGIDVLIVVAANSNTAAAIVREAHDYDVPVIGYDRLIKNSDLDYLVTFEGAEIGNLMVNYALSKKPEGNYVLLWGDAGDVNALLIKEAQEKILNPSIDNGRIKIVYKTFVEDWSKENAYHIMKNVLSFSNTKIDAIITSYDGIAMGAIKAIEELGYDGDIIITGQDAELESVRAINEGKMSLTVYKSISAVANAAVELSIKLAKNQKVTGITGSINNGRRDVPVLFLKPVAVTKDNLREVLIGDKFYTEEQIFGKK
jgi:D-xylose transport system substrate-binding protein